MAKRQQLSLKRNLKQNTRDLAELNREMASQLIMLASQTGEVEPLKQAVDTLRKIDTLYSSETTPRETAEIRQTLADTLLTIGKATNEVETLEHAIAAYRDAITLASVIGDETMRKSLKRNYGLARSLLGNRGQGGNYQGAA